MEKHITLDETLRLNSRKEEIRTIIDSLEEKICTKHLSFGQIATIEKQIEDLESEWYNINLLQSTVPTSFNENEL